MVRVAFLSVLAAGWSWVGGVRLQAECPLRSLAEPKGRLFRTVRISVIDNLTEPRNT